MTLRPAPILTLLVLAVVGVRCSPPDKNKGDSVKGPPTPEQRFGNDPELVADFANLKTCVYRNGRLDYSCKQLKTLQQRLMTKSRDPKRRVKVVTTLANLLESRRELTRRVAADSVFFHHQDPKITTAVRRALEVEKTATVRATLLRQACWKISDWTRDKALLLLAPEAHPLVQAEAATCLGRFPAGGPQQDAVVKALTAALEPKRPAVVRGNACAALGALGIDEAVPHMAKLLRDRKVDWRCSAALAQLGTETAYRALFAGVKNAVADKRMPPQHVSALASYSGKPFFEGKVVTDLLLEIASKRPQLGWIARKRAVTELARLGAKQKLVKLRALYATKLSFEGDPQVVKELKRHLPRQK